VLLDFLGAGFSDAPKAFSYSLEDHAKRARVCSAAGVRLYSVPQAGHGMMWENPDGFVSAVKRALTYRGPTGVQ
jgi:pimeloyl-ACP methyl ester carboxylesterase